MDGVRGQHGPAGGLRLGGPGRPKGDVGPSRVVLLDLDGTITRPVLDFERMRAEMGLPPGQPILEQLERLTPTRRACAEAVLERHERAAAETAELNDGCRELLSMLAGAGFACGLVTRNSRRSVEAVLSRHNLAFGAVVTRDDPPFKPHPHSVALALRRLGVPAGAAAEVWMVGDGVHDVEVGRAAGVRTVWVSHGAERRFAAEPDHEAADLFAVARIVLGRG
ncbi:MAG: HAD family hydrolase [Tepidisphaerales bacterium]